MRSPIVIGSKSGGDYELIDSGFGEKLERYGEFVLARPDPQALWPKHLPEKDWQKADAFFSRDGKNAGWSFRRALPERWVIDYAGLKFYIRPSAFKHTGLFPEQAGNWSFIKDTISRASQPVKILNLFGYTGGATLAAASAGASVAHIDGSKVAIGWTRDNAELSGLAKTEIRSILEDAGKFVKREVRRKNVYDGLILDPPAFGHGPNKELWKIEDHLLPLLTECREILSEKPLFVILNGYASGYSSIAYANALASIFGVDLEQIEHGELAIQESGTLGRYLPCGIFARFSSIG